MKKVLMIGIDSLDPVLLSKFEEDLPNFKKLRNESPGIKSKSIYPVDSIPAWITIYTGLNPSNHGILDAIDFVNESHRQIHIDTSAFRGRTFWDFAGASGKKVYVINPFLAYPIWQVNGVMLNGPSLGEVGDVQAFPESILNKYELPYLGGFTYPLKGDLKKYHKNVKRIASGEAEFGLKISKNYDWDLFFIFFPMLDPVQHFYWRFYDESDPTYPGDNNPYKNVIKDFYKLFDEIIGKFVLAQNSDTVIVVFSDHGMGRRCTKLVNINEFLREKGLLVPQGKKKYTERIKGKLVDFVYKHELEDVAIKLATIILRTRNLGASSVIKSPNVYDQDKTVAYTSDFAGMMKSFGGIKVISNQKYEGIRNFLVEELAEIRDPSTGEKIVKWVCKREELYSGQYIQKYPDVVFELKEEYGISWSIYVPFITNNYAHRFNAGGHTVDATFLISNLDNKEYVRKDSTLMDIAPTVMDILSIKDKFSFDGTSVFETEGEI